MMDVTFDVMVTIIPFLHFRFRDIKFFHIGTVYVSSVGNPIIYASTVPYINVLFPLIPGVIIVGEEAVNIPHKHVAQHNHSGNTSMFIFSHVTCTASEM